MRRILLVHQPTDGGVGRHIGDLASELSQRAYEVILCGPQRLSDIPEAVSHRRLGLERSITPTTDLLAFATLIRIVREARPDVVHAHSSKAGAIARLGRAFFPRVPLLYSPHLYAFAGYFERPGERKAYRVLERLLAPLASRVLCVCEAEAHLARAIGPPSRVRVIYNGIGPAQDSPPDPRIAELSRRGPVIGTLTLLHRRKGIETLIDATPEILAHHPRTQLVIVGDGTELEALRSQANRRGLDHAVHFLGPSTDTTSALRGMEIFVHPSWADAFPYVILEAMAVGVPIVASNVGGIGEALIDGESGLLIPPANPQALARAVVTLLGDVKRRGRMARAAQSRVQQHFTRSAMIDGITSVYDEVLS